MRRLIAVVALAWLALPVVAAEPRSWTGDPVRAAAELERQWAVVADSQSAVGIRGLLRFAVEAAGIGWHPERVAAALDRARAMQDLDSASATFGNFKWRSEHPRVLDHNAVEFAMQLLGFLHRQHGAQVSPAGRRQLEMLLTDGIEGLRRHPVRIDYTNIFVMKAWGLIAAGEALGRADVAADGYRRFEDWLRHTARQGISEYGGVTYYGIDLDSLALITRFAGRAEGRAQALMAMRYLWADIAANWWAPGDRLGGTNARSYDYLYGRGYLEAHTWTAGWLRERPDLEGAGWLGGVQPNQSVLRDAVRLVPPAEWTEPIRAQIPRTVVQRWGAQPEQRAVHWMGRRVSLASSGASRGSDERTLVANLGDSPQVPQLVLFMDGRGDPFGTKKTPNAANQAKALHLTPFIATAQRGPEVVQLLATEPRGPRSRHKPGELSCFLTHLTLPAAAEIWIGDTTARPESARRPTPVAVPPGTPVFVRMGDAALAVRVLLATTTEGTPAPVELIADSARAVAWRLTVTHATGEPSGRGMTAVWLRAREGMDEGQFAAWRRGFAAAQPEARLVGTVATLVVPGEAGPLTVVADVAAESRQRLEGAEPEALLSVNGRDLGREWWAEYRSP
jgi:hypothetical protein